MKLNRLTIACAAAAILVACGETASHNGETTSPAPSVNAPEQTTTNNTQAYPGAPRAAVAATTTFELEKTLSEARNTAQHSDDLVEGFRVKLPKEIIVRKNESISFPNEDINGEDLPYIVEDTYYADDTLAFPAGTKLSGTISVNDEGGAYMRTDGFIDADGNITPTDAEGYILSREAKGRYSAGKIVGWTLGGAAAGALFGILTGDKKVSYLDVLIGSAVGAGLGFGTDNVKSNSHYAVGGTNIGASSLLCYPDAVNCG